MLLYPASEADYPDVVNLANMAFRGTGTEAGWNSEAGFIDGPRLTESLLRSDLAAKLDPVLLLLRDNADGPLLGTVLIEPKERYVWHLGLLTVRPDQQNRQLGRTLLTAAENFARQFGGQRIRMTVVNVRQTLIAWYERRGYRLTGEVEPFPYDDQRFGKPLRDDLSFVVLEKEI